MKSYSLDAIKKKIESFSGNRAKREESTGTRLQFWKPVLKDGESTSTYQVRFLPYRDKNGQPLQEIAFYTSQLLIGSNYRQVAPVQFELDDPIYEKLTELSSTRQEPDVFKVMQQLRPKESFFAPIIVRGEEDKGVQIWELKFSIVKSLYSILGHPDYSDEDLFHPEEGRDFMVSVVATDKIFTAPNGKKYPVNEIELSERKKTSKLAPTKAASQEIIESIPDIVEYFKSRVRDAEFYQTMLDNALAGGKRGNSSRDEGTNHTGDDERGDDDEEFAKSMSQVEDAFADF